MLRQHFVLRWLIRCMPQPARRAAAKYPARWSGLWTGETGPCGACRCRASCSRIVQRKTRTRAR
eukprot:3630421-Rhodomonas_salina.1